MNNINPNETEPLNSSHQNPQKSGQKAKNSKIILIISIIILLALLGVIYYLFIFTKHQGDSNDNKNGQPNQQVNIAVPEQTDVAKPTPVKAIAEPVITSGNSYIYNGKTLGYTKYPQADYKDYIRLYIIQDGKKIYISDNISTWTPGGTAEPKFQTTDNPEVAQMSWTTGDMGGAAVINYYININNKKILNIDTMTSSVSASISINNTQDGGEKIATLISNEDCGDKPDNKDHILKDITYNNIPQKVITESKKLKCEYGSAFPGYTESPSFVITSVSTDFQKIYFSLNLDKWDNDNKTIVWKNDFVFDVTNKKVSKVK